MAGVEPEVLATGTQFGSYVIVRRLGKGSYGSVYEALRQPLNRRVALKVLHRQMAAQEQSVARFLREATLVASLEHPHIVGVFDVGETDGVPFLAMEFLEGESLGDRLKAGAQMSVTEVADLLLPIFSAVATVHERAVVHRDLKPDNIMLARNATGEVVPKLLDFGIAKVTDANHELTRTNALMGTPFYMSPEQAKESKHIDARTDQWALGVIAWQCVAGRKPFRGNSLLDVLNAVANGPIEPLRLIAPATPELFERALLGALQRDPSLRYPTVWDFGWQLLPFASPVAQARWRDHFAARLSAPGAALPAADLSVTDRSSAPPAMSPPLSSPTRSAPPTSAADFGTFSLQPSLPPASAPRESVGTLEPRAVTLPAARSSPARRSSVAIAAGVLAVLVLAGVGLAVRAMGAPGDAPVATAHAPAPIRPTVAPAPVAHVPVAHVPTAVARVPAPVAPAPTAPVVARPVAQAPATAPASRLTRAGSRRGARTGSEPAATTWTAPPAQTWPAAPATPRPAVTAGRGDDNI